MHLQAAAQLLLVASFFPFLDAISNSADSGGGGMGFVANWWPTYSESARLGILGSIVIAAVVIANLLGTFHSIAIARFSATLDSQLASRLLRGYLMRPYAYHLNRNSSEFLRTIFSEIGFVTNGFLASAMGACAQLLTILGIGTLLFVMNPGIALAAGVFFGTSYALIYFLVRKRLVKAAEQRAESDDARYQAATEAFATIKELKILGREPYFLDAFERPSRDYFQNLAKAQLYSELPRHLVETIAFGGMVGIALLLLRRHGGVAGALPVLGVFAVAGYRLLPAIKGLYSSFSQLRYYRESVDTIYQACGELNETFDATAELPAPLPFQKMIEFRNVSFTYPGSDRPVLHNIDLTLPVRARIGLRGRSGAGKTTLADLILGLFAPGAGEIRIDGVLLTDENRRAWQRNCGYVPQQICLIDGSVRANIAFGIAPEAIDDAQVRAAAQLANLREFVENELPEGYETQVGERGVRLSGGQRQRIGIARALYHNPEVIVLDEATSSLDPETEEAIVDALRTLAGRKTVIMIAHHFATIQESDILIHLDKGRLADLTSA
jgi:ABC-type bacteriocin/lantibiotic exporter with double-glycine peptidase domain